MISTAEPGRDGAATAPMVVMYVVELVELEEVLVWLWAERCRP